MFALISNATCGEDVIKLRNNHFSLLLPLSSSSPKSFMISPIDFSISSILLPTYIVMHTHFVDPSNDVGGHLIKPLLHLLQHVLHELVELLCVGVLR